MKSHICWCVIDYTLMVIDYQWLISKNEFPKVTILQVTCFWRFFQKSQLFKWLVLKKLPRVTNFDLSHQEIINMWPWHKFHNDLSFTSSSFNILELIFQYLLSSLSTLWTNLSDLFLFIFLKVFVEHFLFQENFFDQKLVLLIFFHSLLPLPKEQKD